MNQRALYNLLKKYLNQSCSEEERKMVDEWLELLNDSSISDAYSPEQLEVISSQIWQKVQEQTYNYPVLIEAVPSPRKWVFLKWAAAAAIIGLVALMSVYILNMNRISPSLVHFKSIQSSAEIAKQINNGISPLKIVLEDSTLVVLEPGAMLSYPRKFSGNRREVYLEGKAFFDVTRKASQPFFIFHNKLVTRVLGTSFLINTQVGDQQAEVSVISGRVEVSENTSIIEAPLAKKGNGVLLACNQKVTYSEETRMFVSSIIDVPVPVKEPITNSFLFDNTDMHNVLSVISDEYGIEIIVENEAINKCTFTGVLGKKDMYEKLDIICRAINCSYEQMGTMILIKGEGCL